jgi:hypothetical protein
MAQSEWKDDFLKKTADQASCSQQQATASRTKEASWLTDETNEYFLTRVLKLETLHS